MLSSLNKKLSRSASGTRLMRSNSSGQLTRSNSNSSLVGGSLPSDDERGSWRYLVVDAAGIRPRNETSYSKETKDSNAPRTKEGSIVDIVARRKTSWTTWLQLATGAGWLHDVSPKDWAVRMVEVEVIRGDWEFQVGDHKVYIFQAPSMQAVAHPPKGGARLEPMEVFKVCERIRPLTGKGSFLRLADFRGFVFDVSKGKQVVHRYKAWHEAFLLGNCSPMETSEADLCGQAPLPSGKKDKDLDEDKEPQFRRADGLHFGAPEHGSWDYIVLEPTGISLRTEPTFEAGAKNSCRLAQGDVVKVIERRKCDGTTFLRLESPPGWCFDLHQRLTGQRQRIAPVEVEHGQWEYRVGTTKGIALRKNCSLVDASKIGRGPAQGALLSVIRRVRLGEITFCRLKDSNAWVPDCKDGRLLLEGPLEMHTCNSPAMVKAEAGVTLMDAPTRNKWAVTKRVLLRGAVVQMLRTCQVEGELWAHIAQPGGMEGWCKFCNFDMEGPAPILSSKMCDRALIQAAFHAPSPVAVS